MEGAAAQHGPLEQPVRVLGRHGGACMARFIRAVLEGKVRIEFDSCPAVASAWVGTLKEQ